MKKIILLLITISLYGFNLKYKEFSCDFNQSVKSQNKSIFYKGKLFVKNNLILWDYESPLKKKIWLTNNNKIYVYEPDLYQTTIYQTQKMDNFFKLLKTAKKIKSNLFMKTYNNKKIYFTTKNNLITKIYYKDRIGNLVTLNFYNVKKEKFNKKFFIPSYPKDVDIIYAN